MRFRVRKRLRRFFKYLLKIVFLQINRVKHIFCCKNSKRCVSLLRGKFGEDAACEFLKRNGYKIIRRNWQFKHREIDIIAVEKCSGIIVFVEVKLRNLDADISGYFAVSKRKRAILRTACLEFLKKFCEESVSYRFDIIEISYDEVSKTKNIHHYENVPLF